MVATFHEGSKIYDSYRQAGDTIYGTLSGIIGLEDVTISNFLAFFKSQDVGTQLVDISSIVIRGATSYNYIVLSPQSLLSTIHQRGIVATFYGGQKIYDSTNYTGPVYGSLSGMVTTEILTISTYITRFHDVRVGKQLIDISNLILAGPTFYNYYVIAIPPINSYIDYKTLVATFIGGSKIYDSTYYTGPVYGTLSGIIGTEVITISTFITKYQVATIGYQLLDISNLIIAGPTFTNYYVLPIPPIVAYIDYKSLVATFHEGSKIYDSYREAGSTIYGTLSGIIGTEGIDLISFSAFYKDPNTGNQLIDISSITLSGITLFNYYLEPVPPILRIIYLKSLSISFIGGSKIYNKSLSTGLLIPTLSGIIGFENISVLSFDSYFDSYLVGLNNINFSNILLKGDTSSNYIITEILSLSSYIHQKPILINSLLNSKTYDTMTIINDDFNPYLTNLELDDLVTISSYYAVFRDPYYGVKTIGISSVILTGPDSFNYRSDFDQTISGFIYQKLLTVSFLGVDKIYDGLRNAYNLPYTISGNLDPINLISYNSDYQTSNIGTSYIDISHVTLSGSMYFNYSLLPSVSIFGNIYIKNIYVNFSGGSKTYDRQPNPGPTFSYTISGIVNNENIYVTSFNSYYNSVFPGDNRIDISNLQLDGATISNYILINILPVYATISKRAAGYGLNEANKIYDSTNKLVFSANSFLVNIVENDIVFLSAFGGYYNSVNVGNQQITLTRFGIFGLDSIYYTVYALTSSGQINPRGISASFTGGTKTYNQGYNTGTLSGFFQGLYPGDSLILNTYTSRFRSNQVGNQFIDVSNITFSGLSANNYFASTSTSFISKIFPQPVNISFSALDKNYDTTTVVYGVSGILSGVYPNDIVNFNNNYTSKYDIPHVGRIRVDISNVTLIGSSTNNYIVNPIIPFYSNIFKIPATLIIYGGDKVYDRTNLIGPYTSISLSGIIDTIQYVSSRSYYNNINYGYQSITISNIIFSRSTIHNYNLSINQIYGFISAKPIIASFTNLNKTYDKTNNNLNTISAILNSIYAQDNIYITGFTGLYKTNQAGSTFIDISNIIIEGTSKNNYILLETPPLASIIFKKFTNAIFSGGNKTYDNTLNTYNLQYYLTDTILYDDVYLSAYLSSFDFINVGQRIINFSNPILGGNDSLNYSIQQVNSISATIFKKQCSVTFSVQNKIYDNNNIAYLFNPILYNLDAGDLNFVNVSSYISTYDSIYSGYNKTVTVANITISGLKSQNYVLSNTTIYLSGFIEQKQVLTIPKVKDKIYDQITTAYLSNITLSGIFNSDLLYVSISNYLANYNDYFSGLNKLVTINNIVLNGPLAYNYYTIPIPTLGNILKKPINISFTGVDKNFDNTINATVINPIIYDVIIPDVLNINSYNSNYINIDVGTNKVIIVNNIIFGGSSNNDYICISSYTFANITTPTNTSLTITNPNSTYLDPSNNIIITFNPIFERQNILINSKNIAINNLYSFYNNGSIYVFNNNNYQWQIYQNLNNILNNVTNDSLGNYILSSTSGNIYISNNNLSTITNVNLNINQNIINTTNFFSNTGYLITRNQIYKSINNGLNWTNIYTDISNQFINITSADLNNVFIVGRYGLILYSINGGTSWNYKNLINQVFNSIFMYDIFNGFIVGNNGIIYKTTDGNTWSLLNAFTSNNLNSIYSYNRNDIIVVGDRGLIIRSITRGINWTTLTSGSTENFTSIYTSNNNNIIIGGTNGIILNYIQSVDGILSVYDSNSLLFNQNINKTNYQLTFNFTNYQVKRYLLNAKFIPNRNDLFGQSNTSNLLLTIKPKFIYNLTTTNILFDISKQTFSEIPIFDQSGGTFSIIDSIGNLVTTQKVSINSTNGQLTFIPGISVNRYTIIPIYTLNNISNQVSYTINIIPNIIYTNNLFNVTYQQRYIIPSPYVSPLNGRYTISDSIGTIVKSNNVIIDSISGFITVFNNLPISNNILNVIYTFNNLSNNTNINIIVSSIFTYNIGITTLNYQSNGTSEYPTVTPSGGIFSINDLSGNLVASNKVFINTSLGIISFLNSISVGFYYFNINYLLKGINKTTIYKLNATPFFKYQESTKVIEYIHTIVDGSSIPLFLPLGGYFTFFDYSNNLISNNYITTNVNSGQIIYNDPYPNYYSLLITYYYNLAYRSLQYNVIVKPTIYYTPNLTTIIYNTVINSEKPTSMPIGGLFTITELDNILYQTKFINIDMSNGIIYFNINPLGTINLGTYNFRINYNVNGVINSTIYTLKVTPLFLYSINTLKLYYDSSANSVSGYVYPTGGTFSLSGNIENNIIINTNNGIINFPKNINIDNYIINVLYTFNNLPTQFMYYLTVYPNIYYNNLIQLFKQTSAQYSGIPYTNPSNGLFQIYDISNNLVNNYITIDYSGNIAIQPDLNVGIYFFKVIYTINSVTTSTIFNLIIKPNLTINYNYIELNYDRTDNYISEQPFIDQSGGIFILSDIIGNLYTNKNAYVDSYLGITYLNTNINVGRYILQNLYTLNYSFNTIDTEYIIKPILYYTISSSIINYMNNNNSIIPYTNPNGGNFVIYDVSFNYQNNNSTYTVANNLVDINFNTGIISFQSNINVGNYVYLVNYIVNKIITPVYYKLTILPNISYNINELTIVYDSSGISVNPTYSQPNGIFTIYDFSNNYVNNSLVSIDSNGIIYFELGIDVGRHTFIINYNLNFVDNQSIYNINVLPIVNYNPTTIYLLYERLMITPSLPPYYQQLNGYFIIKDYIGEIVSNKYVEIDISSGIIYFNDYIDVNTYELVVYYNLNNLQNLTFINLVITPNLTYVNNTLNILYGFGGNSELPIVKPLQGRFSIYDISGSYLVLNFLIRIQNNSGLIIVNTNVPVGNYEFIVTYTLNNLSSSVKYYLLVAPNLSYRISNKTINYGTLSVSVIPSINPTRGDFSLTMDDTLSGLVLINKNNGQISFNNNIDVRNYIILVNYTFNLITTTINYYLVIKPVLIYQYPVQTILYNHEITYSEYPIYYQLNGLFTIYDISSTIVSNNQIIIDSSGLLFFDNYINIGNYNIRVDYLLNDVNVSFIYELNIIPNLNYTNNNNQVIYKDAFDSGSAFVDPSGGIFTFSDLCGNLISANLITTDAVLGNMIITNFINVGYYTININYTLNNISNNTNYILNILPIIEYSIGDGTKIYSTVIYSEKPFVDQPGGYFYTEPINGVIIDTSFGIITFNYDMDVNNYNIPIYYILNNISNSFIYKYLVYPLLDYDSLFINTVYNNTTSTGNAIYDPRGGFFYLTPNFDISSSSLIVQNYIDISYIVISQDTGQIYFDNKIDVGKYIISVFYSYNNITSNVNLTYIMQPYILYISGYIETPYRQSAISETPIGLPYGGIFNATVPRINLIYTGIYIDPYTGIITVGRVNAGYWILTCTYTYNDVTATQLYYLQILANIFYTPPYEVIAYNSLFTTSSPSNKNPGGQYGIVETISGFAINKTTGALTFSYLTAGVYYIQLSYLIFGSSIILQYTLVVKPTIIYRPDFMITTYTNPLVSVLPMYAPPYGIFSAKNNDINNPFLSNNIRIDTISGLITTDSILRVGLYNLLINYIINDSTETVTYTITIYPNYTFPIGSLVVNYGSNYYSERAIVNPKRGIFTSMNTSFTMDNSGGRLFISTVNNVGKYIIPIKYTFNGIYVMYNYNLIINPLLTYNFNTYDVIYGNYFKSDLPNAKEANGNFTIKLIDSTFPIQITYNSTNQDIYNDHGVIFNLNNGLIYFGNKINVGFYNFNIKYSILDLSSNFNFKYNSLPNVYYYPNTLEIGYQTIGLTSKPFRDQSGGNFTFNNVIDIINQLGKINLNNRTGVISFYKGVDVGFYNFKVNYTLNNIVNIATFDLTIKPIFNYKDNNITVVYDSSGNSEYPTALSIGGRFYIYDNGGQTNISINYYNGLISINNLDISNYKIILKYIYNQSFTLTNYYITVIPYINYPIGKLSLSYGNDGLSELPIGLQRGGYYSFYNLTEYGEQLTKLSIDSISGVIYFNKFINSGVYNTIISYTYNNLFNTFNYILNVNPYLDYGLSGPIVLSYNSPIIDNSRNTIYYSNIPNYSPIGGIFKFKDNSNNSLQNNVQLNNYTGQIIVYNKPRINNYIFNIQYFLKKLEITYNLIINIYPNFSYSSNNILIKYNTNNTYTYSGVPYHDPSGGIFNIINPIDFNLFNKVSIENTGRLIFNNNINIGKYSIRLNYNFPNNKIQTIINYSITSQATVIYSENILNIIYKNIGYSSVPFVIPSGGLFDISNNIYNQQIDIKTGKLIFTNLEGGTYLFNITYTFNDVITNINYNVNIISLLVYDPSGLIINYSLGGNSSKPIIDLNDGIFSIPYNYTSYITIDRNTGILNVSKSTPINNYNIPITYTVLNLTKSISYLLTVKPYYYYDTSSITLLYNNYYKSSKPFINPSKGYFDIKLYDTFLNYVPSLNYNINISGIFNLNNLDVSNYFINTVYTYNTIPSIYQIKLTVIPIFYYNVINNIIYSQNNLSIQPIVNPVGGTFISLSNDIGFVDDQGIIQFNSSLYIGNNTLQIQYIKNFVSNYYNYNFNVIPYIIYNVNNTESVGNTFYSTISALVLPPDGYFNLLNNNDHYYIDNMTGIIYFDSSLNVNIYNIIVKYTLNTYSNTFVYNHNILPYISYSQESFNFGNINYSNKPFVNTINGLFSIEFILDMFIQSESISIDSSSGIIRFNDDIIIGYNKFYVVFNKSGLSTKTLYQYTVKPNIKYEDIYIIDHDTIQTILPIIVNPLNGLFNLYYEYDFVDLINSNTGEIQIITSNIGYFNFPIVYTSSDISNTFNINLLILSQINYPISYEFDYGFPSETDPPIVSMSGGIFNLFIDTSNIYINNQTGIIYFNNFVNVNEYYLNIYYSIYDVSSSTILEVTVKPYLKYDDPFIIEYGNNEQSNTPEFNPKNGKFSLLGNLINGITINKDNGSINVSSITKKDDYYLDVQYIYNNITQIVPVSILIQSITILIDFQVFDKVYDGTSDVKVKSNKILDGYIINNDKVFISSYDAKFTSTGPNPEINVIIDNVLLGGPDSNNYNVVSSIGGVTGTITYTSYPNNDIKINKGIPGDSGLPNVSDLIENPSFIIQNIISGITIDEFGIIKWDGTQDIGSYAISVLVFNPQQSTTITFNLNITTNLYTIPLTLDLPVTTTNLEYTTYPLRYSTTSGLAYAIDPNSSIPSGIAKYDIRSYDPNNGNLNHDLGEDTNFVFNLPNADPNTSLLIYELNDDGTTNPNYQYLMTYIGNNNWSASFRYLSDFYIQDLKTIENLPPTFSPKTGSFQGIVTVTISALPNSVIYYTLDGTQPSIDTILYTKPFVIKNTLTIKALAFTPGYKQSSVSDITYTIVALPCILSNTLIKTPTGYEFIDNLKVDDIILTYDNREVPIINVLKYEIVNPKDTEYPVIIPKDFFGLNLPNKDTYISETHAILCPQTSNEWILPYNNISQFKRKYTNITYFNLELPNYFKDHIVVNNLPIESWSSNKFKYKYLNKIQKIINNKKIIVTNKFSISKK